jgi:hypothetical protein
MAKARKKQVTTKEDLGLDRITSKIGYYGLTKDRRVSARIPTEVYELLKDRGLSVQRALDLILSEMYDSKD